MHELATNPAVLAVIAGVSALQSVFGVGVLLFGTPLLLLLGHEFTDVLTLLLPVSLAISTSQVLTQWRHVERRFLLRVAYCALPAIVLGLGVALWVKLPLGLPVAAILLLCGLRGLWPPLERALSRGARHERAALVLTGLVHGLSNLGGSLLSVQVHQKGLGKDATRASIAAAYALFASSQLATVAFVQDGLWPRILSNLPALALGLVVYGTVNALVFRQLDARRYGQAFASFLVVCGLTLALRSL